ncbi:MAG: hypothetical protein Q4F83_06990 [Eubacteriales bacterium]|nr:hypothetical protein [Eubacteriales bacterium]
MVKKRVGYAVRMILFVLIAAFLWKAVEYVVHKPKDARWYSDGLTNIYKEKDYYDVLIAGTSIAIANTNSAELYHEYGIASTSIGAPQQSTCLSYYAIEETLKYQKPEVLLFDVKSLFYSKERISDAIRRDENTYLHFTLDDIKSIKTRYKAFLAVKEEFYPEINFWEYFCDMYYGHSYWESITEEEFTHELPKEYLGGNRLLLTITPKERKKEVYDVENSGQKAVIPACNKKYLIKIIELCKEKDIDLVLLWGNGLIEWKWAQYNAVREIADEYGIPYLDINLLEKQIGIDWTTDNADNVHMNLSGARKWMGYVGDYLKSNYDLPDCRLDENYEEFEKNEERYLQMVKAMEVKKDFAAAEDFKQYMQTILSLDKEGYAIFMAGSDDMTNQLDAEGRDVLQQLGITKNLEGKFRYSFLAVIDDGEVVTQKLSRKKVSAEAGLNNGKKYQLYSGGQMSGVDASLIIDETEWMKDGRGINIVVYDKEADEVLSSVYFDTCAEPNPAPKK